VPTAPIHVVASPSDGAATIKWETPASDGGSAITGYTVIAGPGGKTCTTNGALTCTITGLRNGTTYTFTVVAHNAVGDSPESVAHSTTTTVPHPKILYSVKSGPILFGFQSYVLTGADIRNLTHMLPQLRISKKIKVYGYTQTDVQSAAAKAANKVLAHHRSEAVITWLKAHGVNAKFIIVAKGVLDPASTTNQALNRRVEFEATF